MWIIRTALAGSIIGLVLFGAHAVSVQINEFESDLIQQRTMVTR